MTTKIIKQTESNMRRFGAPVLESAHDFWRAGIGAISLARRESARAINESGKRFDKLVAEGEKFERKLRKSTESEIDRAAKRLTTAAGKVPGPEMLRKVLKRSEGATMTYHLVPKDDQWAVRREGSDHDISVHPNKKSALTAARGVALAHEPSRLVVHRADGTIQDSYSYGEAA
jgi:hypothetical protein